MRCAAWSGLVALAVLAACGNDPEQGSGRQIAQAVTSGAKAVTAGRTAPAGGGGISREVLAQVISPAMVVTIDNKGQQAIIGELRSRNGVETWASVDDVTISMRDGVIVATRGFGADLMAADVPSVARLREGASAYQRAHVLLNGEDQPIRSLYTCTATRVGPQGIDLYGVSYSTHLVQETCEGGGVRFRNDFWIGSDGSLRKSRQWLSPDAGYLTIEDVRRRS